jgi:hypothetical protein
MLGEDSTESELEENEPDPPETPDSARDTIPDWPADAIPSETIEPDWTPGEAIGYAKERKPPLLPGQRRPSSVSQRVGVVGMGLGFAAVTVIGGTIVVISVLGRSGSNPGGVPINTDVMVAAFLLGCLLTLAAIIVGTIGRLNATGRSAATLGRRIGCGIPLTYILLGAVAGIANGDIADVVRAIAFFILVLLVGFLIILIADAILGTN